MELAGGIILGITLLFSLLAFNPTSSSISDWINKEITALRDAQTAGIGASMPTDTKSKKQTLSLLSPAFANESALHARYTCDGTNVSPPLLISGVPEEAQSLVLIME